MSICKIIRKTFKCSLQEQVKKYPQKSGNHENKPESHLNYDYQLGIAQIYFFQGISDIVEVKKNINPL